MTRFDYTPRELAVTFGLELALEVTAARGEPSRDLAVLDEAWNLVGMAPFTWTDTLYLTERGAAIELARAARARRNRKLLTDLARGVIQALEVMHDAGILSAQGANEARRLLWLDRRRREGYLG